MTVEERIGRALSDLADDLRPLPDPLGRIEVRRRRDRRRRTTGALCAIAVVAALALVGAPGANVAPRPAASPTSNPMEPMLTWAQRLADSPPRGIVAEQDPAYVRALTARIEQHLAAKTYLSNFDVRQVKVLFVDDLGPYRMALVAFDMRTPRFDWPHSSAYFKAPRGASADVLAGKAGLVGAGDALEPVFTVNYSDENAEGVTVSLAPVGCQFSTAAWPEVKVWLPEPTVSYLVRTDLTQRAEWWRITCDGRVRQEKPADRTSYTSVPLSAAEVTRQIGAAGGRPDRAKATEALTTFASSMGYAAIGPAKLIWGGHMTWPEGYDGPNGNSGPQTGQVIVVAVPLVHGGWTGEAIMTMDKPGPDGNLGFGPGFSTAGDPTGRATILPIRLGDLTSKTVLVIAPKGAANIRAVRDGAVVATAAVAEDAAILTVPDPATVTFEALDGQGRVLNQAEVPDGGSVGGQVDNWNVP